MKMTDNYFYELNQVDVSKHVEQKGRFNYLSWPYAVSELGKRYPSATWVVKHFPLVTGEWHVNPDIQVPYLQTPAGFFVEVAVTVEGVIKTQVHPVLDNYNKPIPNPNSFQINTSIQRALAKCIALHGLGLYIFAGEDLPEVEQISPDPVDNKKISQVCNDVRALVDSEYADAEDWTYQKAGGLLEQLTNDERIAAQEELKKTKPEGDKATYFGRFKSILKAEKEWKNSQPAY